MVSFKTFATLHDCCAILVVFAESHNLQNMYGGKNQLGKKKSHQKRQKKHFIVFVAAERLGCHLSVIYSRYCTYSQQEKLMRQMGNRHRRNLIEINQTFGFIVILELMVSFPGFLLAQM